MQRVERDQCSLASGGQNVLLIGKESNGVDQCRAEGEAKIQSV